MFRTRLRKPEGMSNKEFYGAWLEEAAATREAIRSGAIKSIYKVPGKDEVIGVMDVDSADSLDRGIHALPLWRLGYSHLVDEIEWTALRPYENWADDLEALARG